MRQLPRVPHRVRAHAEMVAGEVSLALEPPQGHEPKPIGRARRSPSALCRRCPRQPVGQIAASASWCGYHEHTKTTDLTMSDADNDRQPTTSEIEAWERDEALASTDKTSADELPGCGTCRSHPYGSPTKLGLARYVLDVRVERTQLADHP